MATNSKKQAKLNLGVTPQEVKQATKDHREISEYKLGEARLSPVIQKMLDNADASYASLALSGIIDLDDHKFYYASIIANLVVREQGIGKYGRGKDAVNKLLPNLIKDSGVSVPKAHGVLSMAFHAINPNDTYNIAKHLIEAVKEESCPPLLRKRLADMGYTTPQPAGIDEHGNPYYQWKGKNGIASSLSIRKRPKKS